MPTVPYAPQPSWSEIDVDTFAQRQQEGLEDVQLIDVREPWELTRAAISGFINLPLSAFDQWAGQIHQHLDSDTETIVMCHHGIRSAQMCQWLQTQGFSNVKNLSGGIDAFAVKVNREIPRY